MDSPVAPLHGGGRLFLLFLFGCGGSDDVPAPTPAEPPPPPEPPSAIAVPAQGSAGTLDVATWNLLHFGSVGRGPGDEALQSARVRDVILGTDFDIWAVQEVADREAFTALLGQLPGYEGLLSNDVSVPGGPTAYGNDEIKVGLVYKQAAAELTGARIILSELDYEFAGRPPLEARFRIGSGKDRSLTVIVLHAKALADAASWERRRAAAEGLRAYLETYLPDEPVVIPGDWNDDVDESILDGRDTPYRSLVDAAPRWVFPTARLSASGARSMPRYSEMIDHILASDEAMAWYEEGSEMVYRVNELIPDYLDTTSDHLPVLVRFRLPG